MKEFFIIPYRGGAINFQIVICLKNDSSTPVKDNEKILTCSAHQIL
jgi:hypothetical protein